MFVVLLKYIKPIEIVDQYLLEHRAFLEEGYQKNYFVVSGPCKPRNRGVIISQLKDREQLENILNQDPFKIHDIALYEFIEFEPVKYQEAFKSFCL